MQRFQKGVSFDRGKIMIVPAKRFIAFVPSLVVCLLILFFTSCVPEVGSPKPTSIIQTVVITRVITRVVTSEVTQVLEVPITDTPFATPIPSPTPYLSPTITQVPSATPIFSPPQVTVLADSGCYFGPSTDYLLKYGLFAYNWMWVVGRNPDGTWLNIKSLHDPLWNACWIKTDQVKFDTGNINNVPIVWMVYPYSILYDPPTEVSAKREGNVVTIFWQPVYMTEDDYRGYMIEAWVCQEGRQVFHPIGYVTSFSRNNNMMLMSVQVMDEPGCDVPSNARIYAVEKHGYTAYRMVPWPGLVP
jgi:hypothetical protein